MRVLVTRPEPDASSTAARLRAAGHVVLVDPMLTIVPVPDVAIAAKPYQAVLVTSANALRALAGHPALTRLRSLAVLAVGARTAQAARALGFAEVAAADGGGVDRLAELAQAQLSPTAGPLLYLAGTDRAGGLDAVLRARGYAVDLVEAYRARAVRELRPETQAALAEGGLDAVLLASARTAVAFRAAVEAAGLTQHLQGLTAACLSPAIARAVADAGFSRIVTAAVPKESELLAALGD